jgi:hypothetical protein
MNFSSQTTNAVEVAEPVETNVDRLAEVEREYGIAKDDFADCCQRVAHFHKSHKHWAICFSGGKCFVRTNALLNTPAELRGLEHARERANTRWSELLAERARLRQELGLCR